MVGALITGNATFGILAFWLLGLGAAWMTGRALALGWDDVGKLVLYLLILAVGVRFIHFALYGAPFVDPLAYLLDAIAVVIVGLVGFRYTRTEQMVTQYHWLYERVTPLSWKERPTARS
jgi:hypothetical protein